jgi:hypothetical protein
MKLLLLSSIAICGSVIGCGALPQAHTKLAPAAAVGAPVAETSLAGQYAGKWMSTEGTAGGLRIKLRQDSESKWVGEATFTYEGAQIPGKVKTIKADGAKVRMVFDWEIQGTAGQSTISGELVGDTLEGTYETNGAAGASKGTWNVTRS